MDHVLFVKLSVDTTIDIFYGHSFGHGRNQAAPPPFLRLNFFTFLPCYTKHTIGTIDNVVVNVINNLAYKIQKN